MIHTTDGFTLVRARQPEELTNVTLQEGKELNGWRLVQVATTNSIWRSHSVTNGSHLLQQMQMERNIWSWGKAGALALSAFVVLAVTAAGFVLFLRNSTSQKIVRQGWGADACDINEEQELLNNTKDDITNNDIV